MLVVQTRAKLTVYFEEPFWVGLYERWEDGRVEVCKITFGAEPKDHQVYERMLGGWNQLRFGPSVVGESPADNRRVNPKRMQRVIRRTLEGQGSGTKAQQALQLQREAGKKERRAVTRQQREAERERQFALRREKRREKHRGH
nr:YjdF family protein [Bittarella massiliensis (ex Durand et al. 2017)]